jgi:hypothetical protein
VQLAAEIAGGQVAFLAFTVRWNDQRRGPVEFGSEVEGKISFLDIPLILRRIELELNDLIVHPKR